MKTCKCGNEFVQYSTLQNLCVECLIIKGRKIADKNAKVAMQTEKREIAIKKKALLTIGDWKAKVDAVYNPFIRKRDEKAGLPCPSCLRFDHEIPDNYFGKWDCGHYLSKGSHPELRYEELNTWRQCKSCNGGSGKYAKKNYTVSQTYKLTLIEWIGLEKVEWLEGPHEPKLYRIPDLMELEKLYKQKLKEILI